MRVDRLAQCPYNEAMTNIQNMTHDDLLERYVPKGAWSLVLESEYGPVREYDACAWRFFALGDVATFGSLVVAARTYMEAVEAAGNALDTEQAFWKS